MKVKSVETIKDCFKHGGKWIKEWGICRDPREGSTICTLPYKGLVGCWAPGLHALYGIDGGPIYEFESDFMQHAASVVPRFLSDLKEAIESHDDFVFHDIHKKTVWRCYNGKGKVVSCKQKNAILSNSPHNVILGVRNLRKIKPLYDLDEMDVWVAASLENRERPIDSGKEEYEKFIKEEFEKEIRRPTQYHFSPTHPENIYSEFTGKKHKLSVKGKKRGKKK